MSTLLARLEARDAGVVVIGQGYVGLTLAMSAGAAGFSVTGIEADPVRLRALRAGASYVDDVPDSILAAATAAGYEALGSDAELPAFDVAVIAVPTPLREGRPDLTAIETAAEQIGRALLPGALVVLESTTYPGTTSELLIPLLEKMSGLQCGTDFVAGYSPERIDPGNLEYTLGNTPKIVAGADPGALDAMCAFYGAFVERLVPLARPEEAELAKLLENTFRHVNIALVNELAAFAHELDVDLWAAINAAATKPFGFMPFRPGPGAGGHCLPVDPSYLSWHVERRVGAPFRFVQLANEVNARMPGYVAQRIQQQLSRDGLAVQGARILVLGLAYKPDTGDVREAPSLALVTALRGLGAEVTAADPHVDASAIDPTLPLVDVSPARLREVDLVVIATNHAAFDIEAVAREAPRVFDTRNCIAGRLPTVERL